MTALNLAQASELLLNITHTTVRSPKTYCRGGLLPRLAQQAPNRRLR
jgi:hypothetical protein